MLKNISSSKNSFNDRFRILAKQFLSDGFISHLEGEWSNRDVNISAVQSGSSDSLVSISKTETKLTLNWRRSDTRIDFSVVQP